MFQYISKILSSSSKIPGGLDLKSHTQKLSPYVTFLEAPENTFPYCNCILIEDDVCGLVDSSTTPELLEFLKTKHIDILISTHGHIDHNYNNARLKPTTIMTHEKDRSYGTVAGFLKAGGVEYFEKIAEYFNPKKMGYQLREASEFITDGQVLDFGRTKVEVLHLPGHTPGHCGLLFSDLGIILSSDISFHSFGPWYGNVESDVSEFLTSIDHLMSMKPERLITSHTSGIITANILAKISSFRDVIFARERKIINAMYRGKHNLWDIVDENIIYRNFHQPQWRYFEWFMIRSHLKRLIEMGRVFSDNDQYYLNDGIRPSNLILG